MEPPDVDRRPDDGPGRWWRTPAILVAFWSPAFILSCFASREAEPATFTGWVLLVVFLATDALVYSFTALTGTPLCFDRRAPTAA